MKKMKQRIGLMLVCCAFALLVPTMAKAAATEITSGQCGDNLAWVLTDDGILTISGEGAMTDFDSHGSAPWSGCSESVTKVVIEAGVTTIGDWAFAGCEDMVRIEIGDDVADIGKHAFSSCSALEELVFGESVSSIGDYAFEACSFTQFHVPSGVTEFGCNVFNMCEELAEFTVDDDNTAFAAENGVLFSKDMKTLIAYPHNKEGAAYTVPSGVITIGDYAFIRCGRLKSIVLSDTVNVIGEFAFSQTGITSLDIPVGVTSVAGSAFYWCYNLEEFTVNDDNNALASVDGVLFTKDLSVLICYPSEKKGLTYQIPAGVTTIGSYAFSWNSLTTVECPSTVARIMEEAFSNSSNLRTLILPAGLEFIGNNAFKYCFCLTTVEFLGTEEQWGDVEVGTGNDKLLGVDITFSQASGSCGEGLVWILDSKNILTISGSGAMTDAPWNDVGDVITCVVVEEGVTTLCDFAFANQSNLTEVSLPESLENIGNGAFSGCSTLPRITIPRNVATIGSRAFENCTGLSVFFPLGGFDCINAYTFYNCSSLNSITIPESVDKIGDYAFDGCSSLERVGFRGREEQWYAIEIGDHNDPLLAAKIDCYIQAVPPQLTVENIAETGKPRLSWNEIAGSPKYEIYRAATESGEYQHLATVSGTDFIDQNAEAGVLYFYKIRTIAGEYTGNFCGARYTVCSCAQPVIRISLNPVSGKPMLTWDAVKGAAKYEIWRSTSENGTYYRMYTQYSTTYTNTTAVPGVTYYYKVVAICGEDTEGNSAFSRAKYITCDCAQPVTRIGVNPVSGKPTLTWDAVEGATKYEIWRSTSENGTYYRMYTQYSTTYTNTTAVPGEIYYYKVVAICGKNAEGNSAFSKVKSVTCGLAKPVVTISINAATGKPVLTWDAVNGAVSYEVWRATSENGTYYKMYTFNGTKYSNTIAEPGVTYYYKVRAIGKNGASFAGEFSTVQSITCCYAQPKTKIWIDAASGLPTLSWDAIEGAVKYEIWRATSQNGTYYKMYTQTGTKYTNTTAKPGETYYYKVRAIGGNADVGASEFSAVQYITCDCARPVVTATVNAKGLPYLTWKAVEGATKYEIWRATSENGTYYKMYTVTGTSYTNTTAESGKTYYYKVIAICGKSSYGNSAYSNIVSVKVP